MAANKAHKDPAIWFEETGKKPETQAEYLALGIVVEAEFRRQALGLSYSDIARRMGVSRQHVHKLMSGTQNSTIGSLSKLALALDCELKLSLDPSAAGELPEEGGIEKRTETEASAVHPMKKGKKGAKNKAKRKAS